MTRSYKKTARLGNTYASSEKKDKQIANRKLRRLVKQGNWHLTLRDVSNVYRFSKDGKKFFDREKFPELLRK